jgi:hypothetical protein
MHASVELSARVSSVSRRAQSRWRAALLQKQSPRAIFLKAVAPTKLVDGAWLYGTLEKWQDPRFTALIRTYLEELGEGLPTKNHVVLYRKLLELQGCDRWDDLPDDHYVQGAIQLSLAYNAERFLPEVIGFNLGYEQLPLHLLITAYELKELHIDPYYFTLHITVDNADSGHAKQAVDAVFGAMPRLGDADNFWRRVRNGYRLNLLGASTNSGSNHLISNARCTRSLRAKPLSASMRIRIIAASKAAPSTTGYRSRPVPPTSHARWKTTAGSSAARTRRTPVFWKLIHGEKAKMFGVFNAYEQQVIYDWIAADADRSEFDPKALPQFKSLSPEAKQQTTL